MRTPILRVAVALVLASYLTGCVSTPGVVPTIPASSSSPSPSASQLALTPEQSWDTFNTAAAASCQEAYKGLVEEDIAGPEVGKLKIRLTFEQAGENTMAYLLPNGETGILEFWQFYACEITGFLATLDSVQVGPQGFPTYSANLPLQVTFNSQDSSFTTVQQMPDGSQRSLVYTIANNLITRVQNLQDGSETTVAYGQPSPALTAVVNDFYTAYFAN